MRNQRGDGELGCAVIIGIIILIVALGGIGATGDWLWELVR